MSDQGTSNYFNLLPIILAQCDSCFAVRGSQEEVVCLQSNAALPTPT